MAKYVNIEGNQVIDLTPDYNRPLALVDITVLNKLTELLPKGDFSSIRHNFREQIMNTSNLEQLVQTSEDFIAFHRTVNLIREIVSGDVNQIQEVNEVRDYGNVEMSEL
jgi:CHAD domain-containing protein